MKTYGRIDLVNRKLAAESRKSEALLAEIAEIKAAKPACPNCGYAINDFALAQFNLLSAEVSRLKAALARIATLSASDAKSKDIAREALK